MSGLVGTHLNQLSLSLSPSAHTICSRSLNLSHTLSRYRPLSLSLSSTVSIPKPPTTISVLLYLTRCTACRRNCQENGIKTKFSTETKNLGIFFQRRCWRRFLSRLNFSTFFDPFSKTTTSDFGTSSPSLSSASSSDDRVSEEEEEEKESAVLSRLIIESVAGCRR